MIRGVVFDLDGVLADTEPVYQAMRTEYLSRFGVTLTPEQSRAFTGLRFLTGLEMLRAELPETVFRKIQEGFHPWEIDHAGYLRAAVPEVLDQLRLAGLKTAIASNSTPERIARFLETGHLQGRFDAVCSGADFGRGKPEPDVYLAACRQRLRAAGRPTRRMPGDLPDRSTIWISSDDSGYLGSEFERGSQGRSRLG